MAATPEYDALIVVTAKDYERVRSQYHRLAAFLPARRIFFAGNEDVELLVKSSNLGEKVCFLNENDIRILSCLGRRYDSLRAVFHVSRRNGAALSGFKGRVSQGVFYYAVQIISRNA